MSTITTENENLKTDGRILWLEEISREKNIRESTRRARYRETLPLPSNQLQHLLLLFLDELILDWVDPFWLIIYYYTPYVIQSIKPNFGPMSVYVMDSKKRSRLGRDPGRRREVEKERISRGEERQGRTLEGFKVLGIEIGSWASIRTR